jgi:T5SS/PEP-CTERM-associated repeat protein
MKRYIKQWIKIQGWLMAVVISTCLLPSTLRADIPYTRTVVYYDQPTGTYTRGVSSATALGNLLGHFKTTVDYASAEAYTSGQMASYDAIFYVGAYFDAPLPAAFLSDACTVTKTLVWINNNIWTLLKSTNNTAHLGLQYRRHTNGFDSVTYKNEWLYASSNGSVIAMAYTGSVTVLATLTSRTDSAKGTLPYVLKSSNFWYIADNPFQSSLLCDRSLVLADLLHDILGSRDPQPHRGLARIEDIAPALTSTSSLVRVAAGLTALGAPATYSVIPRYRDPLGQYTNQYPADLPMTQNRPFLRQLRSLVRSGAFIAAHGYTHESGDGESGDGWEFWNYSGGVPLPYDSWDWAKARVTNSANEFLSAGFLPNCWETPHYVASLVDYPVFSELYRVSHERLSLHGYLTASLPSTTIETLSQASSNAVTQWLPYPSYRNYLGTRTLPEALDRHRTHTNEFDPNGLAYSISNKVNYARKFRVVRDAVASFYYHPGHGLDPVSNLVTEMQALGYTFANPETLSREEAVTIHTNPVPYESNTTRLFNSGTTNLYADLVLGHFAGNNTFSIRNGAGISNEEALIGFTATSHSNTMLVCDTGSTWFSAQTVFVGYEGNRNIAAVTTNGTVKAMDTVIGMTTNATGNGIIISGTESLWTNRYGLTVGRSGSSNAAYVMNGGQLHSQFGELGATMPSSANLVCIGGTGSLWTIDNDLSVGNGGSANQLDLLGGGKVKSVFGLIGVAGTSGSNRTRVTDPGTAWSIAQRLFVGVDGSRNNLDISNGATMSCSSLVVGDYNLAVSNTVSIENSDSTLSIAGDLIVGADGSFNRLIIENGAHVSCSNIIIGQYPSAGGNEIVLSGHDSALIVSNAAGLGSINIVNGKLRVESGTLTAGSFLIGPGGSMELPSSPSNTPLNLTGDFICSGTNPSLNLMEITLVFSPASQHRLGISCLDQGASLQGFVTNRALSKVDVGGTVTVTNVCYAWELSGTGSLEIPAGSTFYYVNDSQWSGSAIVTGNGRFVKIPITFSSLLPSSNGTMLIGWNSASGLSFSIEWKSDMTATNFFPATNLIGANNTDVWIDAGDVDRPAPGLATQRFYRLKACPP